MKMIRVNRVFDDKKDEENAFNGKKVTPLNFEDIYTGKEDLKILKENDEILCIVLRKAIPKDMTKLWYKVVTKSGALRTTMNRAMSSGIKPTKSLKQDGTVSNTLKPETGVESSIVGFYDRYPRTNYCRKTSWTQDNPKLWRALEPVIQHISNLYKIHAPEDWAIQNKIARATSPDFVIPKTVFTTITLNRNFRTAMHRDRGNLTEGLACMSYIQTGNLLGGHVVFPNYKIGTSLKNGDIVIFNNKEFHGNTEINPVSEKYERITAVFFFREKMQFCGTAEEELNRAKQNKGDNIIGPCTEDLNGGRWK